jgi:hypothetical protein
MQRQGNDPCSTTCQVTGHWQQASAHGSLICAPRQTAHGYLNEPAADFGAVASLSSDAATIPMRRLDRKIITPFSQWA